MDRLYEQRIRLPEVLNLLVPRWRRREQRVGLLPACGFDMALPCDVEFLGDRLSCKTDRTNSIAAKTSKLWRGERNKTVIGWQLDLRNLQESVLEP